MAEQPPDIGMRVSSLKRLIAQRFGKPAPRNLQRDLERQSTEGYWRRRRRGNIRRLRMLSVRYKIKGEFRSAQEGWSVVGETFRSMVRPFAVGALLIGLIVGIERLLAHLLFPNLIPTEDQSLPLWAFPTVAVTVLAGFLGIYLATVGIVVGTYSDVTPLIRRLLLRDQRSRSYLKSLGKAIGYGLLLLLLHSVGIPFGYMTMIAYALFVAIGGWAFFRLALGGFKRGDPLGTFDLFDPTLLAREPLLKFRQSIESLDSNGIADDDIALYLGARRAKTSLHILRDLIHLIGERKPRDLSRLVDMIEDLLTTVRVYAARKHLLGPASRWFLPKLAYPRWAEADNWETTMALHTASPLSPRAEPATDWLELEAAEIASSALKVCVDRNDADSILRITRLVADTAKAMAISGLIDEAMSFSDIFRERCSSLRVSDDTAHIVASSPLAVLTALLLGWRAAVLSWDSDICRIVDTTDWDKAHKAAISISGPVRFWKGGHRLLQQIRAELDIEGTRITPDWHLRSELAGECLQALREFSHQLPPTLDGLFRYRELRPTGTPG